MLIPSNRAGEFGCFQTRALPQDQRAGCAGRKCAAWSVLLSPGQIALFEAQSAKPGHYQVTVELGCCGLLPRAADTELASRRTELVDAGFLKFVPRPGQSRNTVLSRQGDAI